MAGVERRIGGRGAGQSRVAARTRDDGIDVRGRRWRNDRRTTDGRDDERATLWLSGGIRAGWSWGRLRWTWSAGASACVHPPERSAAGQTFRVAPCASAGGARAIQGTAQRARATACAGAGRQLRRGARQAGGSAGRASKQRDRIDARPHAARGVRVAYCRATQAPRRMQAGRRRCAAAWLSTAALIHPAVTPVLLVGG